MATRKRGKRRENRHERRQAMHNPQAQEWDAIRLPVGLEVFKPEADQTYHIDVIPYVVGQYNKNAEAGDEYFELSYAVYNNLGVNEKRYIAIGEQCGMRDPVAEHFASLRAQGAEWEDMKNFKPKWRQLMLWYVHEQADKGLQLFEGAFGTFGEKLDEELADVDESWADNFDDPDGGATLRVRFKGQNIGQANLWVRASSIRFVERPNGFEGPADVLNKAAEIQLESCLKIATYDELKAVLEGRPMVETTVADDARSGTEQSGAATNTVDDDVAPWDEEPEPEPEPPKPKRKRATKAKAKPEPAPEPEPVADDGDDDWDDDWD